MAETSEFSDSASDFLKRTYSDGIRRTTPLDISLELFQVCKDHITEQNGIIGTKMVMLKGWAFETAIFPLLHTDQKILLYLHALKLEYNQSRVWKLLGLEYFNARLFHDAVIALNIAIDMGLDAIPNATYELLGACLTHIGSLDEGKATFLKSSRIDYDFILRQYKGITQYADTAFRRDMSISREDILVYDLSMQKFFEERKL